MVFNSTDRDKARDVVMSFMVTEVAFTLTYTLPKDCLLYDKSKSLIFNCTIISYASAVVRASRK